MDPQLDFVDQKVSGREKRGDNTKAAGEGKES